MVVHWLELGVSNAVTWVQYLVKELWSHMSHGVAPNKRGGGAEYRLSK